jgi:hypothetical protein
VNKFDGIGRKRTDTICIDPDNLVEIVGIGFDVRITERGSRNVVDVDAFSADPTGFGRFDNGVVDDTRITAFPLQFDRSADDFALIGNRGLRFGEG